MKRGVLHYQVSARREVFCFKLYKSNLQRLTRQKLLDQSLIVAHKDQCLVHALFGGTMSHCIKHNSYNILVKNLRENYSCNIEVLDQPVICGHITRIIKSSQHVRELKIGNIHLTELLLRADFSGVLYSDKAINLSPAIVAIPWIWSMLMILLTLKPSIADLRKLEVLGVSDPKEDLKRNEERNEEEVIVLDHFRTNLKINSERWYEVKLLWKENKDYLLVNTDIAEKILNCSTSRLINTLTWRHVVR
ncbi:hypothetical protein PR048_017954 [Dryococelus australis]|uniref:Uncharacterized protein n=1 Tax=Dryococelus australis TaxID=614101 RepID=A0ABQ9HAW5_9NEOP|nr:hypothetical protein PR048_017954 [Dryococelus australis]